MKNTSGIKPVRNMVLVLPDDIENKTKSGIVLSTNENLERLQLAQTEGVVVEVAAEADHYCKVGDRVIFKKYSGIVIKGKDEKTYRLIDDLEIGAIFYE